MSILTRDLAFGLIGGLGFFLYGQTLMGQGFQKLAGERIRKKLETTESPMVAVAVGLLFTVVLQNGGAATVLVIGLLSAGLLGLGQAVAMMLGINIGISLIAQVTAFKLGAYSLLAVGVGFVFYSLRGRRFYRYLGQSILGFGLVFSGLNIFSLVFGSAAENILVRDIIDKLGRFPITNYFLGAFSAALTQNNTVIIGLLQRLASQPVIQGGQRLALMPLKTSLPFLFGTNLGICAIATLYSIKGTVKVKRATIAQWLINLPISLLMIVFITPFTTLTKEVTSFLWRITGWIREIVFVLPSIYLPQEAEIVARQIAVGHTIFNLLLVVIWAPLLNPLLSLLNRFAPTGIDDDQKESDDYQYLDEKMFDTPSVALRLATKEIMKMAEVTMEMLSLARVAFIKGQVYSVREVEKREEIADQFQERIILYLSTLLSRSLLTTDESRYLAGLMHAVNDVERIADHANYIAWVAEAKIEDKLPFSELAMTEIALLYGKVVENCQKAFLSLVNDDHLLAKQVLEREEAIDRLKEEMRQNHINRLNQGKCWPGSGIIYVELIASLERVAGHATNIAQVTLNSKEGS